LAKYLNVKDYFIRSYISHDKDTVEDKIGVLRRFFPKKTDLQNMTPEKIKEVIKLINHRHIRKINYNNPIEKLKNKTVALMG
jgi:IS30 family transposase